MIIDGHSHACGKYLTAEGIIKTLDLNRTDKVVLVPGELNSKKDYSLPNIASKFPNHNVVKLTNVLTKLVIKLLGKAKDIPDGNKYVYDLKTETDNRIIQFLWATEKMQHVTEYLNTKYAEWAFHGVKLHQCWGSFSINSGFFNEVAEWCEKQSLPLFIHLLNDREVNKLITYKKKHPKLKLIIAHLFGLELFIKQKFTDQNLYFDSSPLQLVSDRRLMKAINFVGAKHILMGTDTPYGVSDNLSKSIERIKDLQLSKDDENLILGLNMKKLLSL